MLHIVGNGPSRLKHNIENLDEWWGCNAIQYDYTPNILFSVDILWHEEVISSGYYKTNKVAVGSWEPIEISMWSFLLESFTTGNTPVGKFTKPEDDMFIVQGTGNYVSFVGYNSKYSENLITYDYPELKNLFSGMSALGYACIQGYKDIVLIGMDALQYGEPGNIYEGKFGKYEHKYTKESRVLTAQRSQFIALLKHFNDVNVYFKNDLDELELVKYDKLSYYDECEEWPLGQGFDLKI